MEIRRLKELYVNFNHDFPKSKEKAMNDLNDLIKTYKQTSLTLFKEFSNLLEQYSDTITNSFITTTTYSSTNDIETRYRRLSNGSMEGFNRIPKDLKRSSRGVTIYEFTRTRILWANRPEERILAVPKKETEVHTYTNIKRGPYQKNKKH